MKPSTHDKIEGTSKELAGKTEEIAGKVTGDCPLEARGLGEKADGIVQKAVGREKAEHGR